jgi:NADH:ubiquinone oxidoreductase subunit K
VRDTVFLATVLFLVGISGHFPLRQARYGLIAVGVLLLVFSIVQLAELPGPPA